MHALRVMVGAIKTAQTCQHNPLVYRVVQKQAPLPRESRQEIFTWDQDLICLCRASDRGDSYQALILAWLKQTYCLSGYCLYCSCYDICPCHYCYLHHHLRSSSVITYNCRASSMVICVETGGYAVLDTDDYACADSSVYLRGMDEHVY